MITNDVLPRYIDHLEHQRDELSRQITNVKNFINNERHFYYLMGKLETVKEVIDSLKGT